MRALAFACFFALLCIYIDLLSRPVYWQLPLENVTTSKWIPDAKLSDVHDMTGNSVGDYLPNTECRRHNAVNGFRWFKETRFAEDVVPI
jgi:hypothetical protein